MMKGEEMEEATREQIEAQDKHDAPDVAPVEVVDYGDR